MIREYAGLRYGVAPGVYEPAEDSFLLVEGARVTARAGTRVLELGCGAGLAAVAAAANGARVVATDKNPRAVRLAVENARLNGVRVEGVAADMARPLRGPFDLVMVNPPYLPTGEEDRPPPARRSAEFDAWEAGPLGEDALGAFEARLGEEPGFAREILLLLSTLLDVAAWRARFHRLGFRGGPLFQEKAPFETLLLFHLVRQTS